MKRIDRIKLWFSVVLRILLIGTAIIAGINGNWIQLLLSVLTFLLISFPDFLEKRLQVDFPSEFELLIVFFIVAAIYLGEIQSFYLKFWWWDLFLHALSGVIIGFFGFSLVYSLNKQKRVKIHLSPGFIALFAFSFALALGVVWEVFEFTMDSFFGVTMQKSGLIDTMWDLIVDTLGALLVALGGYFYLKQDVHPFEKLEKRFKQK